MKALMFVILLAAGPVLSADIVTSVNCTVGGPDHGSGSTVTDPHNCSLQSVVQQPFGSPATASATANASFSLASDPNSFSSLSVSQDVNAGLGMDNAGNWIVSGAGSQVSVNEALFTTGNVRSGFVQINASVGLDSTLHVGSGDLEELSLRPIGVDCTEPSGIGGAYSCVAYTGAREQDHELPVNGIEFPFTLGQAFSLNYLSVAGAHSDPDNSGGGGVSAQFQFRFFEADGVTPVAVEAVPEPSSLALLGVALGVFAVGRNKFLYRVRRTQ